MSVMRVNASQFVRVTTGLFLLRPHVQKRRSARERGRLAVLSVPIAFLLCLIGIWSAADAVAPARLDPEYTVRRDLLHERIAEQPHASLTVVLGSSRLNMGFTPEVTTPADGTLWFNMAHSGAGPVLNYTILQRLVHDGIHPRRLILEVMPAFAAQENPRFLGPCLSSREVRRASRYTSVGPLVWHGLRHRIVKPANLKSLFEPTIVVAPMGSCGGAVGLEVDITESDRVARTANQERMHGVVVRNLEVGTGANQAIRDTLALCRQHGIEPVLLLTPESSEFRSWYDPAALKRFEASLAELCREHRVRLIDARSWLADADFTDGHHPLRRGAVAFSQRLVRELP